MQFQSPSGRKSYERKQSIKSRTNMRKIKLFNLSFADEYIHFNVPFHIVVYGFQEWLIVYGYDILIDSNEVIALYQ